MATYSATSSTTTDLPPANIEFKKIKKVLFNEDFDPEVARKYKEMGFKVFIRSSRKIKRQDKKVWNKLKQAHLTEDDLLFGEVAQLDKKLEFDLLMTGQDPMLEMLLSRGKSYIPKKVLKVIPISSLQEAEMIELREKSDVQLKFVTLNFFYYYREIPGIPDAKSGSREFCQKLMKDTNKKYTITEIRNLSNSLSDMGLPDDPFLYRGGFYHNPKTNITTPYCRHQWVLEVSYD